MSDEYDKAQHVLSSLREAEAAGPKAALSILNALAGLIGGEGSGQPLEVEESRANAFIAICEIGKALHRGQPTGSLWTKAIDATERWKSIAG